MIGDVTKLVLAKMLLSSRPNSRGWQQTGEIEPGPTDSEDVRMLRERPLGFEERWPDLGSRPPEQRWDEEWRWPAADEFQPSPLRSIEDWEQQRRLIEEQQRRRLYQQGIERLRRPMEKYGQERLEQEREERLRRGRSMIG